MYERPETPNNGPGDEKARSESSNETPSSGYSSPPGGYTPPPSYNNAPAQDPYAWQPGQVGQASQYGSAPTQPQGGYGGPQGGQPTQYIPSQPGYDAQQMNQPQMPPQYPANYQAGYPQQSGGYGYGQPVAQMKDPTVALLLEFIGLIGFLGIGHIYAGRTNRGIGLLLAWFFYNIVGWWFVLPVFATLTCGLGCIMIIPMLLLQIGLPIGSGLWIKGELDRERAAMGFR